MKTTVLYHSADFDGLFCREIARKFMPDAELIGWDFSDKPIDIPPPGTTVYIMDLPVLGTFGLPNKLTESQRRALDALNLIWIDHHASSIASTPTQIPGYRVDGVAACRLAWFYFTALERYKSQTATADFTWFQGHYPWATKQDFVDRKVEEPFAVRLAGEYDIWDKRDPDAELFQHGLRSCDLGPLWPWLLKMDERLPVGEIEKLMDVGHAKDLLRPDGTTPNPTVLTLLEKGRGIQYARAQEYAAVIQQQGFDIEFEGLRFLACNSHELDIRSHLFEAGVKPHHDGLLGFTFGGKDWRVSLYHAPGKEHHDLSQIAVKYGGGGHRGACGFRIEKLPFMP